MEVTDTIKRLREQKRFTQDSMAKRLNIARSTYSKIESGDTRLDLKMLENISKVLEVPIYSIIHENGDQVLKSISEDFGSMLDQTYYQLSRSIYRAIPYNGLKAEHFDLLVQKGFDTREKYENTPLYGRIYSSGPKEVRRVMFENYGMDVLFRRNLVVDDYWKKEWEMYLEDKNKRRFIKNEDGVLVNDYGEIEIDEHDYFLIFIFELNMPGKKELLGQFTRKDFPLCNDEYEILNYIIAKRGALDGNILCWSDEGYAPYTEIFTLNNCG